MIEEINNLIRLYFRDEIESEIELAYVIRDMLDIYIAEEEN